MPSFFAEIHLCHGTCCAGGVARHLTGRSTYHLGAPCERGNLYLEYRSPLAIAAAFLGASRPDDECPDCYGQGRRWVRGAKHLMYREPDEPGELCSCVRA